MILSPSMLSSDFSRLGEELAALEEAGLTWAHWDVMDGSFVPNITFGPPVIKNCRKRSSLFFDVHLMIREPEKHLAAFADAGADMLVVHAEACPHLYRTLCAIRELGVKSGVAVNPATPLAALEHILDVTDMILIMTVNLCIGFLTPPLGMNLFIAQNVARTTLEKVIIEVLPFLAVLVLTLIVLIAFPEIIMVLVRLGVLPSVLPRI